MQQSNKDIGSLRSLVDDIDNKTGRVNQDTRRQGSQNSEDPTEEGGVGKFQDDDKENTQQPWAAANLDGGWRMEGSRRALSFEKNKIIMLAHRSDVIYNSVRELCIENQTTEQIKQK